MVCWFVVQSGMKILRWWYRWRLSHILCQTSDSECIALFYFSEIVSLCNNFNSLFTPARRTRQNCLVLSCPCRRCEQNWRQDKTLLSCRDPVSNLQLFSLKYIEDYRKLGNWKLCRQNYLVLSPIVFAPPTQTRQDSLVLSVSAVWISYKKNNLLHAANHVSKSKSLDFSKFAISTKLHIACKHRICYGHSVFCLSVCLFIKLSR